ncbi:NAD(P)/FAD-dependent oxidoreductase [Niameybacter massiliensis]|uniref:NAD(P)/FAD-dependent oxidoreductase n=1 Tax=Holtiella tumoricola TaxID=3018743 RepID=A0AA42DLF2_9FIRM|nr:MULTISPECIES: NAD(P)/FAD-dependent oxidoreductase [Lachnospirales]MDA3731095.1 NAD(P)/FAD-dependent oxidoreductase [Holtiella tumoricola]
MANLQKIRNGKRTYAITPHIPGGFITADHLIKIGEVTKKYKGVVKITSGQRILITNLKEEDIPHIWEELGMVPAVKEQNSIKNVEMCPAGFCKRSKVNSIGIGMKLSNKYQWKEMPCRTKIGVAGCLNACGSVYSKDIGVIGDKDGYKVTAGGSAGFHPRLADVLATGLTEREALEYIDRLILVYEEYAEPGEKLGFLIDRLGKEQFCEKVISRG